MHKFRVLAGLLIASVTAVTAYGDGIDAYAQTNLVSDLAGVAATQDSDLVNPWGLTASPTSPFWTSDNGTGKSTLYTGTGSKLGLVVTLAGAPGSSGPADPTGVVFNGSATSFGGSHFLFDTESGTILGWSSGVTASVMAGGAPGSIYKGLGIAGNQIYAANFGLGRIDVFDANFNPVSTSGFHDPNLPTGYAPFNIQNLNGQLYVTYAKTSGGTDLVDGAGLGFVDVFDTKGNLIKRIVSQGPLNAPWGLAMASSNFGLFSNDLLVGNFGDGTIHAFDPGSGALMGTLDDMSGDPVAIPGLWGLDFGNGAASGSSDTLYFNAGIPGPGSVEDHGLFGSLTPVPEPGNVALCVAGLGIIFGLVKRKRPLRA